MQKTCILAILFCILSINAALAGCTFKSSEYRSELLNLSSIRHINVIVDEHRKWAKNSLKILTSKSGGIEEKFRKKFSAKINVIFEFGECNFSALIRQNGDHLDHIKYTKGNIISSLNVKLLDGHLASATRLKFFLPGTRGSESEIFGSMVLRKFDILAPRTKLVSATFNNVKLDYLIQEKPAKEMLEHFGRREGPLLEGDEDLLWRYKDYSPFALEKVSLARLENASWARKGFSSFTASLEAYLKLQKAYLEYSLSGKRSSYLTPNQQQQDTKFSDFNFLMLAMNGAHGMRPHNRKFYYDTINEAFEPIYYDGDFNFKQKLLPWGWTADDALNILNEISLRRIDFIRKVIDDIAKDALFIDQYAKAANLARDQAKKEILDYTNNIKQNIGLLKKRKLNTPVTTIRSSHERNLIDRHLSLYDDIGFEQLVLGFTPSAQDLEKKYPCLQKTKCAEGPLSDANVIKILENNTYKLKRAILLGSDVLKLREQFYESVTPLGPVRHSIGARVAFDPEKKEIELRQSAPSDWFYISDTTVENWTVKLVGAPVKEDTSKLRRRFNKFGLTVCLTFRNINFINVRLFASEGKCEDSVNIIGSSGNIVSVEIHNSFSDGLDIDFSEIEISFLNIKNSRNDCADFSYGNYKINSAALATCGDKSLSSGEASVVNIEKMKIKNSLTGVAAKDFSAVYVGKMIMKNVEVCVDLYRKKQEFGGGTLYIDSIVCDGVMKQDSHSTLKLGERVG